jgi:hypothetical protein
MYERAYECMYRYTDKVIALLRIPNKQLLFSLSVMKCLLLKMLVSSEEEKRAFASPFFY